MLSAGEWTAQPRTADGTTDASPTRFTHGDRRTMVEQVTRGPPQPVARSLLHDRPLVVDLIQLTLNHGLSRSGPRRASRSQEILDDWHPTWPHRHGPDDSTGTLGRWHHEPAAEAHDACPGAHPPGDLPTKLRAFDLGWTTSFTMPFSPEELLARAIVITRRATGRTGRSPGDPARRDRDRPSSARGPGRTSVIPPEQHRAEPPVPAREPCRTGRVARRHPRRHLGPTSSAESNIVDRHIRSLRIKLQHDYRSPASSPPCRAGLPVHPTFSNTVERREGTRSRPAH